MAADTGTGQCDATAAWEEFNWLWLSCWRMDGVKLKTTICCGVNSVMKTCPVLSG